MQKFLIPVLATLVGAAVGHYFSAQEKKDPQVINELQETPVVGISSLLFSEYKNTPALLRAIRKAGAKPMIFSDIVRSEEESRAFLKEKGLSEDEISDIRMIPLSHDSHWLRDFAPLPVKWQNEIFGRYFLSGFRFRDETSLNDSVSYQMALYLNLNLLQAPLIFDGGNFLSNGEDCVLTDYFRVIEGAKAPEALFKHYFGCKALHVVPSVPHDHIDMLAKFVTKSTILVGELRLQENLDAELLAKNLPAKEALDKLANTLSAHYEVIRIPIPTIIDGVLRTYANSVIVNKMVLMPTYKFNQISDVDFPDGELVSQYENEVEAVYRKFGYDVLRLNADDLVSHGGSLHCVTAQLP